MVKFKDLSRPLIVFQVLFKTNFIFKDFSRQSCIFKYISSLCEPWNRYGKKSTFPKAGEGSLLLAKYKANKLANTQEREREGES